MKRIIIWGFIYIAAIKAGFWAIGHFVFHGGLR